MIKSVKQIPDVFSYQPFADDVVFLIRLSDRSIDVYGAGASSLHHVEGSFASLYPAGQEIWALENDLLVSFVLELQGDALQVTRLPYGFSLAKPFLYLHGRLMGILRKNGAKWQAQINQQKEIVARHPLPFGLNNVWEVLDNQTFLSRKDQYFTCHALSDGSEIWRVDVDPQGRWMRFDGEVFEGEVLDFFTWNSVVVALLGNYTTLGIDRTTGRILWTDPEPWYSKVVAAYGKLYQIGVKTRGTRQYVVRDMATGQIELDQEFTQDAVSSVLDFGPALIHRDFYLVTRQREDPRIFIFAVASGALLTTIPLENCRSVPSYGLEVHGDRIYLLDMDNVLHIIEVDFDALLRSQH